MDVDAKMEKLLKTTFEIEEVLQQVLEEKIVKEQEENFLILDSLENLHQN